MFIFKDKNLQEMNKGIQDMLEAQKQMMENLKALHQADLDFVEKCNQRFDKIKEELAEIKRDLKQVEEVSSC